MSLTCLAFVLPIYCLAYSAFLRNQSNLQGRFFFLSYSTEFSYFSVKKKFRKLQDKVRTCQKWRYILFALVYRCFVLPVEDNMASLTRYLYWCIYFQIGHLALAKDTDIARVLSWHMSSDMDCVVTFTTDKVFLIPKPKKINKCLR